VIQNFGLKLFFVGFLDVIQQQQSVTELKKEFVSLFTTKYSRASWVIF